MGEHGSLRSPRGKLPAAPAEGSEAPRAPARLLAALALEGTLPEDAVVELGRAANLDAAAVEHLLARWVSEQVVERVPGVRPLRLTKLSVKSTPLGYRVVSPHRQPALRAAQADSLLDTLVSDCERVLGVRSRARHLAALQRGQLGDVASSRAGASSRRGAARSLVGDELEALLRESICEPFDETWFVRTWGEQARAVALRVLRLALRELDECTDLYVWACRQEWSVEEPLATQAERAIEAAHVLAEHALLREQVPLAERFIEGLPLTDRLGYLAAARYIEDDIDAANRLLEQALAFPASGGRRSSRGAGGVSGRGSWRMPACGAVAPILALLAERRQSADASALARRFLAAGGASARGSTKALRTLQRYAADPDARHRRIDAYQLPAGTDAWGRLLLGVTVQAHLEQDWTRAAWAKSLTERGIAWRAAGYSWMGRQALLLAERLDEEQFELMFEPERRRRRWGKLQSSGLQGELRELVRPPEAWERALLALERVSVQENEAPAYLARVEWRVSALDGRLGRPALSLFEEGTGWSPSQPVGLEELMDRRGELPPEDQRVLRCVAVLASGALELTDEAHEALVGHPRVYDAHGRAMSLESATPHVKTIDEGEGLCFELVPGPVPAGVHVVVDESRLIVYRVTAAMQRVFEAWPRQLRVPKEAEARALEVLAKVADVVEVRGTALGATERVEANAQPCVRIAPVAGAFLVELGVRPFGERGRFFLAGAGPATVSLVTFGQHRRAERDFDRERARVTRLLAECPTLIEASTEERAPGEAAESWILGQERVLALLSELRCASEPHDFEWPEGSPFRVVGSVSTRALHGNLRRTKGWYLATGGVHLDELTSLKLSELVSLPAVARGRFLRLPSGDYVEVERRVQRVMAVLRAGERLRRDAGVRLHGSAVGALRELLDDESGFEVDDAVREWLREFEATKQRTFAVPSELRAELRPYQVEGFRWLSALAELGLGACLADDMGLGKTLQILALLLQRTERGPVLVVAPTSVCTNWVREAAKFAPGLEVREYVGANRARMLARIRKCGDQAPEPDVEARQDVQHSEVQHDGAQHSEVQRDGARGASAPFEGCPTDAEPAAAGSKSHHPILVCSYQVLQQDIASLSEVVWSTVVLDEAQFIKNPASQRARAAFRLEAEHRVAATGTPVENHLGDLWSIFHFLNPSLLGGLRAFQSRFAKPIERDEDSGQRAILRAMVAPYILRRDKGEVLRDLPPLTTIAHEVRFSADEALRYGSLRREIHDKLRSSSVKRHHKLEVLAEITRLRRFCCHPSLVFPGAGASGSKVEAFLELAAEIAAAGHRALVFSQFVDFLDVVRERLHEQRLDYEYLDGSTPKGDRQKRVDAFQAGSAPLFLISLKAGGFGLNLTNADYVIHLDPWWNPAVESQATDRAHRIGQTRPVTVYRLVTKDSIEERIVELHETKRRLAQALFAGGERTAKLSTEDLLTLIEDGPFVESESTPAK